MSIAALLTAEEFARLPEEQNRFSELVRGVVVAETLTDFKHGFVSANVAAILSQHVRQHSQGWVISNNAGVITEHDPDTVRGPDVAFFSYRRLPRDTEIELYPLVSPDLVVEVKSHNDRWPEILAKVNEYLAANVTVIGVVDYESRNVTLFYADKPSRTLCDHDEITLPEVLGDFRVPVRQLFE